MNKKLTYGRLYIVLLVSLCQLPVPAAETGSDPHVKAASLCREELYVFSDRSLYAVNEHIRFTALVRTAPYPHNAPQSSVLYVELVNPMGKGVSRGKFPIGDGCSSGSLQIPAAILSGQYYLRCYTRWMRNFGPSDFTYIPLRIVNPYQAETAAAPVQGGAGALLPVKASSGHITVAAGKKIYGKGDSIEVDYSLPEVLAAHMSFACLSVVPAGAIDTLAMMHHPPSSGGQEQPFHLDFLPDLGGLALSGKVSRSGSNEPVIGARILFSLPGPDPACLVARSDSMGRYILKIPSGTGSKEMCVVPEAGKGEVPEVHIDNDFSTDPLPFGCPPFRLDAAERTLAGRISLQMQLEDAYIRKPDRSPDLPPVNPTPFYGRPDIRVELEDFINLPNMDEVIENLIPDTYIRHEKGRKIIRIAGENPMLDRYDPLILLDHIPMPGAELILNIPPSKIRSIEVLRQVLVLGDARFGGVISLRSQDGKLSGIPLPEGSYYFDFDTFQEAASIPGPEAHEPGRIPDMRNTIYWSDRAAPSVKGKFSAAFRAPSTTGAYLILYRGITNEGEFVYGLDRFKVQ